MQISWRPAQLAKLLSPVSRPEKLNATKEYKLLGVRLDGQGPFLRETKPGSAIAASTLSKVHAGDFIYSRLFAWRGAFGIIDDELDGCYVSNEFPLFRPIKDQIDIRFLNYWFRLRSVINKVEADCSGSTPLTRNRYKEEFFLRLEIPLPPLSEQRRIVAKIEQLAAKIEEARGLRQYSSAENQSIVGNAVRHVFTKQPDKNWHSGCLGDYVVDYCYGTSEKTFDEPMGVPILRMGNIQEGTLDTRDLKYLHIAQKDRDKWILHHNDIIVNRTNSAELVGKCAVFNLEGDWGFASYLIRLRLDLNRADASLVARYINSPIGREYMFRERKQMTGQANVNSKKLNSLPISLPPLAEQRRIVAYLDGLQAQVDRLKVLQAQTAAELEALLPSILDQAFKGEL